MKITLNSLKLIAVLTLIGIAFSCEYHVEEELVAIDNPDGNGDGNGDGGGDGGNGGSAPAATFAADVKPIIDSRCVQCHQGNRFPDLRTYEGVSNNASLVKSVVVNRSMPQGSSLTQAQIDAIVSWVDDGAQNN